MNELIQELKTLIEGDVSDGQDDLLAHSTDWSIFKVMPKLIVYPKHADDITRLVQFVNEHRGRFPELSLTARAAGTDMTGGPLNTSIIVDVNRYMTGVKQVARKDGGTQQSFFGHAYQITGEATVLPGTFYRDFEIETLKKKLIMPCYPASRAIAAVGGMVANNGAGERSLKYGQNKDFVKSLKVVLSDGNEYVVAPITRAQLDLKIAQQDFEGNLYREIWELIQNNESLIQEKKPRTSKNSSGYLIWDVWNPATEIFDLTRMFVGAQGTTGIITEITYKLVDVETRSDLLLIYTDTVKVIPELVTELMKSDLETLEMYDDNTFKIGVKFFRDFIKDKGFFGAISYTLRFLPEIWMALTGGIPKIIILAEFMSNDEMALHREAYEAERRIAKLPVRTRVITKDRAEEKFWAFRHDSFKLLTEHSSQARHTGTGTRTAPFIDDIAINPEYLPEYLPKLIEILEEYQLLYTIAGHIGNGNFHVIPLMDFNDPKTQGIILEVSDRVYALAAQYHGSFSAEHNDGLVRTPYLRQEFGDDMYKLFGALKHIADPKNIFNPGKKYAATLEDFKNAMIKPGDEGH